MVVRVGSRIALDVCSSGYSNAQDLVWLLSSLSMPRNPKYPLGKANSKLFVEAGFPSFLWLNTFVTTWMKLEDIVLSEISQKRKVNTG